MSICYLYFYGGCSRKSLLFLGIKDIHCPHYENVNKASDVLSVKINMDIFDKAETDYLINFYPIFMILL